MSIFSSHPTDLSATYDIVLSHCCWYFVRSLISQHWKFLCFDFTPIPTFGVLILAQSFKCWGRLKFIWQLNTMEWVTSVMPRGTQELSSRDRWKFLIHKTMSFKKKKGCFQPLNFKVISLAATDNQNKYHLLLITQKSLLWILDSYLTVYLTFPCGHVLFGILPKADSDRVVAYMGGDPRKC